MCQLTDKEAGLLAGSTTITKLYLYGNKIEHQGARAIALGFKQLNVLNIGRYIT